MRSVLFVLAVATAATGLADSAAAEAQRRGGPGRGGGFATLAIVVTDAAGAPLSDVLVNLEGPMTRSARTEGGRIAFEELRPGNYRLRFEREGFILFERELTARAGAPTDVKVTLNAAPAPPPPPAPVKTDPPPKPAVDAKPAIFDVPAVFEKEFIGRGTVKHTPLACGGDGSATLIQIKDAIPQHTHAESDEFVYVIGGEGRAFLSGREERLKAGVLLFVPRGTPHALAAVGRNPVVIVSTRAGEGCGDSH